VFLEVNDETLLDAALRYARRGWRVFPCAAGSKLPRKGSRGFLDSTTDESIIRGWWESAPHLNIGLATGSASGVFVLDIDGEPGAAWIMEMAEQGNALPETLAQRTGGRGGRQYFFTMPARVSIGSNAGIIAEGVDVRGDGGYVVLPPSKISGGGRYTWLDDQAMDEPPQWLLDAIANAGATAAACDPMVFEVDGETLATAAGYKTGQGRNPRLAQLVGRAFSAGLPLDTIRTQARAFGARCSPPLPPRECEKTVDSIAKRELDRLRGIAPVQADDDDYTEALVVMPETGIPDDGWQPFPVDCLPTVVAAYINGLAKSMSTDPALIALPMLASMAAAIGNSRVVSIHDDWQEPPILWTAVVCESGTQKTPAYLKGVAFIQEINSRLALANKEDKDRFEKETREHEAAVMLWKQIARSKEGTSEPPPVPPAPEITRAVVTNDTTIECLATRLGENPRGLLLARDELSGWLSSFDRYSGGGSTSGDAAAWLSMFNACPLIVDRKTSGRLIVDRASMCVTGGIQPGILARAIGDEHQENGLLPRFLLASPPRRLKKRPPKAKGVDTAGPARILFETLYGIPMIEGGPARLPLDDAADDVWWSFHDEHAVRVHQSHGFTASLLSKIEAAAARLALVVHLGRAAGGERVSWEAVDATSMARGVTLANWFAAEGLRVHGATTGKTVVGPAGEELLQIVREAGGAIADRTVRDRRRRFKDSAERGRVVGRLVAAGRLETLTMAAEEGGRPALWLRIPESRPVRPHNFEKAANGEVMGTGDAGTAPEKQKHGGTIETDPSSFSESLSPVPSTHNFEKAPNGEVMGTETPAPAPGRIRRVF